MNNININQNQVAITLPSFFSNGMVISKTAKIWGWCQPGQSVAVKFLNTSQVAIANPHGRFEATLQADNFGGPHVITIGDIELTDVYVGHVWLCGGQSNMEGALGRAKLLMQQDIVEDSRIRIFQGEKGLRFDGPATDVNGSWRTATGDMDDIFAVPYFFARELLEPEYQEHEIQNKQIAPDGNAPIGLICIPAGGTPIEAWLPEDLIEKVSQFNFTQEDPPGIKLDNTNAQQSNPTITKQPDLSSVKLTEYISTFKELLKKVKQPGYINEVTAVATTQIQHWHNDLNLQDPGITEGWHTERRAI